MRSESVRRRLFLRLTSLTTLASMSSVNESNLCPDGVRKRMAAMLRR